MRLALGSVALLFVLAIASCSGDDSDPNQPKPDASPDAAGGSEHPGAGAGGVDGHGARPAEPGEPSL